MTVVDQFRLLFTGSPLSYGEWVNSRVPPATTKHSPPLPNSYADHLEGKVGLGIVPVTPEGTCSFAAIDIDVDTINHQALYGEVQRLKLPLHVCRSKSGGAHLYLFSQSPLPANDVRVVLTRWSAILGYGQSEIFPKQVRVTADNLGNWINLPYFGGDGTTRYCVGPEGARSLSDFLSNICYYKPGVVVEPSAKESLNADLPPCLKKLSEIGVGSGARNQALFNYAVFYRKSQPAVWEAKTKERNSQYFTPPLDVREVDGVITSAARTKYQYTCDQHPLVDHCDRAACLRLPFGVGHMPWEEHGSFDDLVVTNCRKLLTDPPKYLLEVCGKDVKLTWSEFSEFRKFKSKVGEDLDLVIAGRKQPSWEQTVRKLLAEKTDIAAPEDASNMGLVIDKLHEFLVLRERATDIDDLLRGLPFQQGRSVLFRIADFKRYLQGFKLDKVEGSDFFLTIRKHGAVYRRATVKGRQIAVWSYPLTEQNEQTEEFKAPSFTKAFEEL